jgi:hypothetical protein
MIKIKSNRQIPSLLAQSWVKTFSSSEGFLLLLHFNTLFHFAWKIISVSDKSYLFILVDESRSLGNAK